MVMIEQQALRVAGLVEHMMHESQFVFGVASSGSPVVSVWNIFGNS